MTLQEQKEAILKTNAFNLVSFDPEKRLERFAQDYEATHNRIQALCNKYGVSFSRISEKHFGLTMAYLASSSRCASWAITGPSRFPAARMEKRANHCHNHLSRLVAFEENIEKVLKRIARRSETQDDKKATWLKKIEQLEKLHAQKKDINVLLRQGKRKEIEEKYKTTFPANFAGFPNYDLRNELANIKRLKAQVAQIDRVRETKAESGFEFDGGKVEFNAEEIRYNIYFNAIPSADLRSQLKTNGFKWSPRRQAWTRGAKTINIHRIKALLGA